MTKVIGVSEARTKFKAILDDVARGKHSYVLARGSKPEAAIIPYDEYQSLQEQARERWNERFDKALEHSREQFRQWLRERGYDPEKLSEEEVERIVRSA